MPCPTATPDGVNLAPARAAPGPVATRPVTTSMQSPRPGPGPSDQYSEAAGMSVTVRVPTTLRTLTAGASEVEVEGTTVGEVLGSLDASHPGFSERILDENGKLRRFVNVFVSDDDVRFLQGLDTPVPAGETVSIVPAVAGGC